MPDDPNKPPETTTAPPPATTTAPASDSGASGAEKLVVREVARLKQRVDELTGDDADDEESSAASVEGNRSFDWLCIL